MAARRVIPGFGLTLGFTLFYLGVLVLLPLAALAWRATSLSPGEFLAIVGQPRVLSALCLSFWASLVGALLNGVFGLIVAYVLVRYSFPGRRIFDAMVDLPFALPTAVAGIALTALYAPRGWLGQFLSPLGVQVAFSELGVIVALTFVGLPFVVRTVQPVLQDLDQELEEAAASLGATRWQAFRHVIFPTILPSLATGTSLAFARALGEYGSVVFISSNLPGRSEIAPLVIMTRLEQFDYAAATAVACVMLAGSFAMLLVVNSLQGWARKRAA